jgi:RND family efflux transporter MFP subunit
VRNRGYRRLRSLDPLALLTASALSLAACPAQEQARPVETRPTPVQVISVELTEVVPLIRSFGSVSFVRKADVSASVEGKLAERYVQEGDAVREGQILAKLSNVQLEIRRTQAEAAVSSAEANVRLAEERYQDGKRGVEARFISLSKASIQLEQQQREVDNLSKNLRDKELLFQVDGISKEGLENARMQLLAAQAALETMEKDLEIKRVGLRNRDIEDRGFPVPRDPTERERLLVELNTLTLEAEVEVARAQLESARRELSSSEELLKELGLRSPLNGVVGSLYVEIGERVEVGTKVLTLFQSGDMCVVFPVQEEQVVDLRRGMEADVVIDTYPGRTFSAAVTIISPIVDPESGSVTVRAMLERGTDELRPGMFARVTLYTGKAERRILLPTSALVQSDGSTGTVLVVQGGRVFRRKLRLGGQMEGKVEVLDGLKQGEEVISTPSPLLQEGALVDVEA